jgi:hypothetical protein
MYQHPFRHLGRLLVAACAVSLSSLSLSAQTPSTTTPAENNPSRVDVFLGYSYLGAHGQVRPANIRYSSVDEGAAGSGAYYFTKYFGGEVLAFSNPNGQNDGFFGGYAGPIFRAPMQNFTLFAHGLAGGVRMGGPNSEVPATLEHEPYTWGASVMAGGGMDYDLPFFNHRFGLRLFEADYRYMHVSYGPYSGIPTVGVLGGRGNLSAAELSTGLLMHFGHIIPPPPVMYSCVAAPDSVYAGDPVTLTGTATNVNPKKDVQYTWMGDNGVVVSGTSNVGNIDTKSLAAGSYTVKGHVSQGMKIGQFADCTATFTVKNYEPPTVGCSANPSTVNSGDPSTITSNGVSPQNRPLTYSYSTTAGTISGNTSTATLQTTGVGPGTISVTCNVVDDKGQTASQMTTVTVASPQAPPPSPTTTSLCTISFTNDAHRPVRVDNEAKACLDDIALNAQRDPNAKLAVIGNETKEEADERMHHHHKMMMNERRAEERAVNTKAYLVGEKGIDASRIMVYTGSADSKTAATTLVPAGATLDTNGLTPVDESVIKAQPRSEVAPHHHHHKK